MDITLYRNGYHGDLNETFFVGDVDEGARKLVQTTYECLMQAIDAGQPSCGTTALQCTTGYQCSVPKVNFDLTFRSFPLSLFSQGKQDKGLGGWDGAFFMIASPVAFHSSLLQYP